LFTDKTFDEGKKRNYVLGTNAWDKSSIYRLNLLYGISNRMEVYASLPVVNHQIFISFNIISRGADSSILITNKSRAFGPGDFESGIRYQFITEDDRRPSLRGGLNITCPTGRKNPKNVKNEHEYDSPTGNGHFTASADVTIRKVFYPYSANFSAFYNYNFKGKKIFSPDEPEIEFKKGNMFIVITGFNFHLNDWIAVTNDVNFAISGENKYYYEETSVSKGGWIIEYVPAIFFQIRRFRFKQNIMVPVAGKNWNADPSYIIGLSYLF
jgi:hypothetical protein